MMPFLKRLAFNVALHSYLPYSVVVVWLQMRLSFSLLWGSILSLCFSSSTNPGAVWCNIRPHCGSVLCIFVVPPYHFLSTFAPFLSGVSSSGQHFILYKIVVHSLMSTFLFSVFFLVFLLLLLILLFFLLALHFAFRFLFSFACLHHWQRCDEIGHDCLARGWTREDYSLI